MLNSFLISVCLKHFKSKVQFVKKQQRTEVCFFFSTQIAFGRADFEFGKAGKTHRWSKHDVMLMNGHRQSK